VQCASPADSIDPALRDVPRIDCSEQRLNVPIDAPGQQAPITRGRDLTTETRWNVWFEAPTYDGNLDHRYGGDVEGRSSSATFGLDRQLSHSLVAGATLSLQKSRTDQFNGTWRMRSDGLSVGPYFGYRVSTRWALNGSLGLGWIENDNQIDVVSGRYTTHNYSSALTGTGAYAVGRTNVRPKISVSYTHSRNDAYEMSGVVEGTEVSLPVPTSTFGYGVTEVSTEINRLIPTSRRSALIPFAEFGARFEFERPNYGQIMTGDLGTATPSPWSGLISVGVRTLIAGSTFIEAGAGYQSFGQPGLQLWQGRLFVSHAF
jgi:hypothetical protein